MQSLSYIENKARSLLIKKYDNPPSFHDIKIINDIIFNEETHNVAVFKEYLIYEEMNEFLKRFYFKEEIKLKMPKILLFYDKYSKIYANYTQLPESKYMYKNIKRKQKMIDKLQEIEEEEAEHIGRNRSECSDIFTTKALDSINSVTLSLYKQDSFSATESDCSVNKMIDQIANCEKKTKNNLMKSNIVRHNALFKKNTSNNSLVRSSVNSNKNATSNIAINYITNIKKKISSTATNTANTTRKNSTLLSPTTIKSKPTSKPSHNKFTSSRIGNSNGNLYYKIQYNLANNSVKKEKILSANSSRSKTERIISSPTTSVTNMNRVSNAVNSTKNINNIHLNSPRCVCNSVNNSANNIRKIEVKKSKPKKTIVKTAMSSANYHSKIFSSRLSKKNSINSINASLSTSKSKSTPKHKKINDNVVVNNVNIINNIQTNSTQINIYNYNDLFKSLPMHSVHNVVKKQMTTTSTHLNNSNHMSSSKPKFELNIRKLMHKNIMDNNESSSERRSTNNFNKHHMKVNSIASSKITETKKGEKSTNSTINKIKLKNLYDLSHFIFKNGSVSISNGMIHSERNKKSKISFK